MRYAGLGWLLALALPLHAADPRSTGPAERTRPAAASTEWAALSPAQRAALAPLQRDWPSIDAPRREKWLEVAARFPSMPPDERARVQERMATWARLPPDARGRARLQFQESRRWSPDAADRERQWQAYLALPHEERQALIERSQPPAGAGARTTPVAPAAPGAQKRNIVGNDARTPAPGPKPVTPTVVQARPGATTNLVSQPPDPPAYHQAGLPKIAATPDFVDPVTLLPRRGAQAAGVAAPRDRGAPPPARPPSR